jgi:hypothetical protein
MLGLNRNNFLASLNRNKVKRNTCLAGISRGNTSPMRKTKTEGLWVGLGMVKNINFWANKPMRQEENIQFKIIIQIT